jgi:hypothetical protein
MQRIGRVDRRLEPTIEDAILADHPDEKEVRRSIAYWNFLPPDELDILLRLYGTVSHKTLRISKTFGIEGRKLLKPEDDYEALRDFTDAYEGSTTKVEAMHLEYQQLLQDYPGLPEHLNSLPGRVFSGKDHPSPGARAVFFCYALPAPPVEHRTEEDNAGVWTEEAGYARWYLYDLVTGRVSEETSEIIDLIRSDPSTPRISRLPRETLSDVRGKLERHIKNTYLKAVQAPIGVKASLKAWMELS